MPVDQQSSDRYNDHQKIYIYIYISYDIYILHLKYQVKPHLSPWFSAVCPAAIVHRNHFFRLYQQNKSSESKVQFRQVSNHCKRVLEAVKLAYANKAKESITSQKLGYRDFWRIVNSVLNKVYVFYFISNSIFGFRLELIRGFLVFSLKVAYELRSIILA